MKSSLVQESRCLHTGNLFLNRPLGHDNFPFVGRHCDTVTTYVACTGQRMDFKFVTIDGAETQMAKFHRKLRQTVTKNMNAHVFVTRDVKGLPLCPSRAGVSLCGDTENFFQKFLDFVCRFHTINLPKELMKSSGDK